MRLAAAVPASQPAAAPVPLVPWPGSVKVGLGTLGLNASSRIIATDAALMPLANVLADEIFMATALRLRVATGPAQAGDVVLRLDEQLKGEQYALSVSDRAVARGGTYRAVAMATATMLQAMEADDTQGVRLPRLEIEDRPVAAYRGLLVDVARQWHRVEDLRPLIQLCRLYKINFLQLHLNDQESFTFPSQAFPDLATTVKNQRRTYTLAELTALVRYADERGVTLVPEIEGPGHHSGALRKIMGRKGTHCLDMASETTYRSLDTLLGEVCAVFKSSPYIHIGADECDLTNVGASEEEKAFMAQHKITSREGLYCYYITRLNEIVRKHGRTTLCWEGFHGDGAGGVTIPRDIIVMPFESAYNAADNLVARGYSVINTAWKPLYVVNNHVWPAQYIHENWNLRLWEHHVNARVHIQLKKSDPVLGAQMCAWEQPAVRELPSIRQRLHAMSERIWNPDAGRSYADFAARAARTDRLLDRLLGIVQIQAAGIRGTEPHGYEYFTDPLAVTLSCVKVGTMRYTIDGSEPTAQSPAYTEPIRLARENTRPEKLFFNSRTKRYETTGDTVYLKVRIFDKAGQALGDTTTVGQYWHQPKDRGAGER